MQQTDYDVAIVGAGISGLACARRLVEAGLDVVVLDKSRGAGGRLCTRRAGASRFDHGAQYFTARSPDFVKAVSRWAEAGAVAVWDGRFGRHQGGVVGPDPGDEARWVGAPRMSALGRHLSVGLNLSLSTRVVRLERRTGAWAVYAEAGEICAARHVLLSCPGPQASALLPEGCALADAAASMAYGPCWAAMVSFAAPTDFPYDGVRLMDHSLGWVARDSSKPGREAGERWVIHGTPAWSSGHLETDADEVGRLLAAELAKLVGGSPAVESTHRWLYALTSVGVPSWAEWDPENGLGLFGDGLAAPRVEAAWLSGRAMAERVLAS